MNWFLFFLVVFLKLVKLIYVIGESRWRSNWLLELSQEGQHRIPSETSLYWIRRHIGRCHKSCCSLSTKSQGNKCCIPRLVILTCWYSQFNMVSLGTVKGNSLCRFVSVQTEDKFSKPSPVYIVSFIYYWNITFLYY